MRQATTVIHVTTRGKGFVPLAAPVARFLQDAAMESGLLTLFCRHSSASLVVTENADPDVLADLESYASHLVPESRPWRHDQEGPDDMPAHVRTILTGVSVQIPLSGGRLMLGTWQGLYLWEHRARPHAREVAAHMIGA
jgi:secondary thiamine-phosphate synthase enzyme